MTTVSLPSGMTPPVKIRAACPAAICLGKGWPAATSPITLSVAGAVATSLARTAYPSIAETAAGGCVRSAAISSASTRPHALSSGTFSTGNGLASTRTSRSASATGIRAMIRLAPRVPFTRFATTLVQKSNALDTDAAFHCLDHVVNRQACDRDCRERLHFNASLRGYFHGRLDEESGK